MAIAVGTGTTIAFTTTTGFVPNVTSLNVNDLSNAKVDTTHLGTTVARTSIPGSLYDPGTIDMDFQFPDAGSGTIPPIVGVVETITITFPSTKTLIATGYLTSWTTNVATEDLMTGSATFQLTAAHTWAA